MATLTQTEIGSEIKDLLGINVSTDAPVTTTELQRAINRAYATVWDLSGGRYKRVASATAWSSAQLAAGFAYGLLTDINNVQALFYTATAPTALTTVTASNTTLTSAALFTVNSIVAGMTLSGTGIPANTTVLSVESASSLTMSRTATDSTSNSRTFSPTTGTKMRKVERPYIEFLRSSSTGAYGNYSVPKVYSITGIAPTTPLDAEVNKAVLDYWPSVTGFYFPMHYVAQFTPLDGSDPGAVPDVSDLWSYDIAYMAAIDLAPLLGRPELIPEIKEKHSLAFKTAMAERESALQDAKQNA